jgi:hypothetical protein
VAHKPIYICWHKAIGSARCMARCDSE